MNERIKELAELAGISVRGYYDETGSTPMELQKFAELIVRECAQFIDDKSAARMLMDHFGVE